VDEERSVGIDAPLFISEMTAHRYADQVREDFLSGVRSGMNGARYQGSLNLRSLLAAIEQVADEA
jgi:predicted RNase H-like nuclease